MGLDAQAVQERAVHLEVFEKTRSPAPLGREVVACQDSVCGARLVSAGQPWPLGYSPEMPSTHCYSFLLADTRPEDTHLHIDDSELNNVAQLGEDCGRVVLLLQGC